MQGWCGKVRGENDGEKVKNPPRFDPRVEPVVGVFRRKGGDGDVRVAREDDERDQESPRERMHG